MLVCGGLWRRNCSKYGLNGPHYKKVASAEMLANMKRKYKPMVSTVRRYNEGTSLKLIIINFLFSVGQMYVKRQDVSRLAGVSLIHTGWPMKLSIW